MTTPLAGVFPLLSNCRRGSSTVIETVRLTYIRNHRVFIIPIFVLSLIVSESPRWLANHDRHEEALLVVSRLQGCAGNPNDPVVQERYREIADGVAFEKSVSADTWGALFVNDRIGSRRRALIACSVQFFQQLGGINAII